jgi:hypothetical protein
MASKDIDLTIGEMIKIRASQISRFGRHGETEQRLALVALWEEAGDE